MPGHSLSLLSDQELLRDLAVLVARDRTTTAALLAHLAEVDVRRLYLPAAYPSLYLYCVHELGLSEDSALKRIRAARTARRFPAIFAAVADGRLSLSVVVLLGPYLTPENVEQLLAAATHQTRSQVEKLLAQRFPGSEMMALIERLPAPSRLPGDAQLAPGPVANQDDQDARAPSGACAAQLAPGPVASVASRAPVARGGRATAARMQLRCRSHNQYGAECTFGTAFMEHKRHEAQRAAEARAVAAQARAAREERASAEALDAGTRVAAQQRAQEV